MKMKKTKKHLAFMLALVLMISCFTMESVFAQGETAGTVIVGSRKYEAVFYNNPAAEELVSKMPFEISMSELNGNEKYKYLDYSLPGNEQAVGQIQAGDIMLYGNDCLVVFYKSFQTSYRYTRIGRITNPEGLETAAGIGSVKISFSLPASQSADTIHLTRKNLTISKGKSKAIKLTGVPANKVKWTSSNKAVARVSKGRITGRKSGEAVITAKYKGKQYKCKVTVKAPKK